jgi:hypothetical protein
MHATVAVLVVLANLSIPQDPDAGARETSAGRIRFVDPPFAVPAELRDSIQFGYLTVPQDHANPAFGTFRSVALIGPVPAVLPHGEGDGARSRARLDVLFGRCRQQASCSSAFPPSSPRWAALLFDRGLAANAPCTRPHGAGSAPAARVIHPLDH